MSQGLEKRFGPARPYVCVKCFRRAPEGTYSMRQLVSPSGMCEAEGHGVE